MSSQPKTLSELYAKKKSQKETEELLASRKRSAIPKAVLSGAGMAALFPSLMAGAGLVGGMPAAHRRFAEEPQIAAILKAQGRQLPSDPKLLQHVFGGISDRERAGMKAWAESTKFNPGSPRAVGALELLGDVGGKFRQLALPPAIVAGILGAAVGAGRLYKRRKEADALLAEAGLDKKASRTSVELSVEANTSFWSEIAAIHEMQKAASLKGVVREGLDIVDRGTSAAAERLVRAFSGKKSNRLLDEAKAEGVIGSVRDRMDAIESGRIKMFNRGARFGLGAGALAGGAAGFTAGRGTASGREKKASVEDVRMQVMQAAFADELEKVAGLEKEAIWGALKKMFGGGGDAVMQDIARRGAAAQAKLGPAKTVIGPAGGAVGSLNSPFAEAMRQRAGGAAGIQKAVAARRVGESLNPGGRVDLGNAQKNFAFAGR